MDYKKAFYSRLQDCYLGVKIKDSNDKSGFTNLLMMKEKYFHTIKNYLDSKIDSKSLDSHDIYNKLYTFFDSFLNDTGTPFFTDTPIYKNIYAKIYSNSKDTSLFYKTQNLYYVKSDTLYTNLTIQDESGRYEFIFDTSDFNQNSDNTKRKIFFYLGEINENQITIKVESQKRVMESTNVFKANSNEFSDDFMKILKANHIKIADDELKKIFRSYKKQQEIDFFIHKNARAFLQEQFDLWMFSHLYKDSEIQHWALDTIERLQKIRNIAFEIIEFIADFENELKAIWLKPKFAKNTQYVFSVDCIKKHAEDSTALLESILKDSDFKKQIKEWQDLHLIDESFSDKEILDNDKYAFLPIDTKYLSNKIRYKLLSSFKHLDSILQGELIKADNFQALNTLMPKYKNKIDLIYIDPPYNAPASEIIYKNNFKDSTWLTMMENRLRIAKDFLSNRGILTCAIDENEQENLGILLSELYQEYEKTCVSVVHNHGGIQGDNFSYSHEFAYFVYPQIKNLLNKELREDANIVALRDWGNGGSERNTAKNCFYPIYVKDSKIIGFGDVCKDDFHPMANVIRDDGVIEVYPIDENGVERKWRNARNTIESIASALICKSVNNVFSIHRIKNEFHFKTCWYDKKYNANTYGSNILTNILPNNEFDYPKSIHTVKDSIYLASKDDSIIMDFFAGSGTTAHAILELNKEGSNRKFVLVEQGEHFYNVIIPRIKKVAFSSEWKNGKLKDGKSINPVSIAFCYYELESYEEALNECEYIMQNINAHKIFDYKKSRKLIKRLNKGEIVALDMNDKYYKNFDIFMSISNLYGWKIKRLFINDENVESVEFDNGEIINLNNVDLGKYNKLKNLIWWE